MDVDDDDLLRDDDLDVGKQESSSPDGSQESESRKPAKKRKRGKSSAKKKKAVSEDISSGRKHVKSRRSTATGKRHAASSSAKAQAKAKTKAKAKAAAAKGQQAGQEDPSQSYDGWKKCGLCRKVLQHDSFNQDQCKCKDCNNGTRQFNRMVEKQECGDKIKKLSAKEPRVIDETMREFIKERNRLLSVGEKIQFNVMDFIVKLKKSEGTRYARISEMMWETEYVEWATKTAKGGYLSKEEAVANWEKWKQDAGHTRDQKGPRGFLRLKVNVTDQIQDYNDMSKEREVEKREKIGKKAPQNAQLMGDRVKLVLAGSAGGDMNMVGGQGEESLKSPMTSLRPLDWTRMR